MALDTIYEHRARRGTTRHYEARGGKSRHEVMRYEARDKVTGRRVIYLSANSRYRSNFLRNATGCGEQYDSIWSRYSHIDLSDDERSSSIRENLMPTIKIPIMAAANRATSMNFPRFI